MATRAVLLAIAAVGLTSCMLPYPVPGLGAAPGTAGRLVAVPYALPDDATLVFDGTAPGASSAVHAVFSYPSGIAETYRIVFTVPGAFTFHGFDALGPAGTAIATYDLVTQHMAVPVRTLTHDTAYVDLYQDEVYDPGVDPLIEYLGDGRFRVTLPNGGDDLALSTTAGFGADATFELLAGILGNPSDAGEYDVQGAFTSVDPDGGDADDGVGTPPATFDASRSVVVACSADAQCDDGDACTADACEAGSCTHGSLSVAARLDCALEQLLDPAVCAPDPVAKGVGKTIARKVAAARTALGKLDGASAKAGRRLVGRIRKSLEAIGRKAGRSRTLSEACRGTVGAMVEERLTLVDGLLGS